MLARCEEHLNREALKEEGYTMVIPAGSLPVIISCGAEGCTKEGAIALKEGEEGVVRVNDVVGLNLAPYLNSREPLE